MSPIDKILAGGIMSAITQVEISPVDALRRGYVLEGTLIVKGPQKKLSPKNINIILHAVEEYRTARSNNVEAERTLSERNINIEHEPNNPYTIVAINAADRQTAALRSLDKAYEVTGLSAW